MEQSSQISVVLNNFLCPSNMHHSHKISPQASQYIGRTFTLLTGSVALHFTEAGALLAARHMRILPMSQHA